MRHKIIIPPIKKTKKLTETDMRSNVILIFTLEITVTTHLLPPLNQVTTGQRAKNNAAFVLYYAQETKPYLTHEDAIRNGNSGISATSFLYVTRSHDCATGFPGGNVDPEESLECAAIRESQEEIGFLPERSNLEILCSHEAKKGFHTHLFLYKVRDLNILKIIKECEHDAKHAISETGGVNIFHVHHNNPAKSFRALRQMPLRKTVIEELLSVFHHWELSPK